MTVEVRNLHFLMVGIYGELPENFIEVSFLKARQWEPDVNSTKQLVSLREKSRIRPHGVHIIIVLSALERRTCFYREQVWRSFRVEKLTITRTGENWHLRRRKFFRGYQWFFNAILEKQSLLVRVEPGEGAFCSPLEGCYPWSRSSA